MIPGSLASLEQTNVKSRKWLKSLLKTTVKSSVLIQNFRNLKTWIALALKSSKNF